MKSKYGYVHGSDIIGTGNEEQEARKLKAKKRKAKALKMQKKIGM
jgi:hypothetical protein